MIIRFFFGKTLRSCIFDIVLELHVSAGVEVEPSGKTYFFHNLSLF